MVVQPKPLCPLCREPLYLQASNNNWIFLEYCGGVHCPYVVEYHGKGVSVPTPALQQARAGKRAR